MKPLYEIYAVVYFGKYRLYLWWFSIAKIRVYEDKLIIQTGFNKIYAIAMLFMPLLCILPTLLLRPLNMELLLTGISYAIFGLSIEAIYIIMATKELVIPFDAITAINRPPFALYPIGGAQITHNLNYPKYIFYSTWFNRLSNILKERLGEKVQL